MLSVSTHLVISCLVVSSAAAVVRAQPAAPAASQASAAVARGQALFVQNCAACHGPTGRGGADAASDLSRSPIANGRDITGAPTSSVLGAFLKVGRPERRMPSFALPDVQVDDLAAFSRTLFPPLRAGGNSAAINAVVVGNAEAGQAVLQRRRPLPDLPFRDRRPQGHRRPPAGCDHSGTSRASAR